MSAATTTTAATLTSTTAPGKIFLSRSELADHYKSDWHKYNLKRREAGLPLLEEHEFQTRWEAALALRQEKEKTTTGTDHIKSSNKSSKKHHKKTKAVRLQEQHLVQVPSRRKSPTVETENVQVDRGDDETMEDERNSPVTDTQEVPEIDPKQSLFDSHRSDTLQENVKYMQLKYGFFIPDQECLVDLEGLLGYCHEKIKLGHYCLYCEKLFPTWQGCQKHMICKQHAKLRYEPGYWDELDPFYDFRKEDADFVATTVNDGKDSDVNDNMDVENENDNVDDEDGWEDMSEGDDDDDDDEGSEELFKGFEKEIARFGLDVTPLGELVFPDGRIVGHRALNRYYKQHIRPASNSTAIVAAQRAAGERVFAGQVVNINQHPCGGLKQYELHGTGKGILVPLKSKDSAAGGPATFSTLSLYRYRAAIRKQRRGDEKGLRLLQRTKLPMNKMDKKANRLANGVSVAHAPR